MSKINELTKEKLGIRLTDPFRASALTMLLAEAAKVAKAEWRDAIDEDVTTAAMNMITQVRSVITSLKKKGLKEFGQYEREIAIYMEFIPESLREEFASEPEPVDQAAAIDAFIKGLPADILFKDKRGAIMALAKDVQGLDRKALNAALDSVLK